MPATLPTPMVIPTSHSPILQNNTFSMPFENVSNELIPYDLEGNHMSVLSPVKKTNLDISSIMALDDAQIDLVLQQDINFMQTGVSKAAASEVASEVPLIEVVSKSPFK